ncbi:NAD(P)/FAD-dependent oxidoreductase [Nocardia sp. CNY236]|uniref:FAD-dependent oxidoreductase n=1 Tax=Nocardia sp. CNY236 TaxID=1169152 RepID=UPI00041059B7|nr:FAD-dependent oxidoreductase [Nocardia sp. CNY236]
MTSPEIQQTQVLVVGGGPTGMLLAGDLARSGHSVTVLERRPMINPSSRAFATMARTLEVLDSRGLAEGLLADAGTADHVDLFFGGAVDLSHLPSRYRYVMIAPQTAIDAALECYAHDHGPRYHARTGPPNGDRTHSPRPSGRLYRLGRTQ